MVVDADTAGGKPTDAVDCGVDSAIDVSTKAAVEQSTCEAVRFPSKVRHPSRSELRSGLAVALVLIVVLGGLAGWLGYQTLKSRAAERETNLFLQAGRQGALNLTTIDFVKVDADIKRVLDCSTGAFHDEFQNNAGGFANVVKKTQAKTVGSVTEAGIESISGDVARVIVTATVNTSTSAAPKQDPRLWRMRITVTKEQDEVKVSAVGFVP